MEMIFQVFMGNPFLQGLTIGLSIALFALIFGLFERRQLKSYILSHMKIYGEGEKHLLSELEKLKEQVSNLRLRVTEYKSKPGRAELRELFLLDRTIKLMSQRAPGFASAWELTRVEIEKQIDDADSGLIAWSKRMVLPHARWVSRMDSQLGALIHPDKK